MDNDLRELLRDRAEDVRISPEIPSPVLHRSRRRRALSGALAGVAAAGVAFAAFAGVQSMLHQSKPQPAHTPPAVTGDTASYEVWFTYDHHLFVARTTAPASSDRAPQAVLNALLQGPTPQEAGARVTSAIPPDTQLRQLSIEDGLARIELSTHVESDPLSDAQVVYTLMQFPDVKSVLINDQEGGPLTRDDLAEQLPAILVEHPTIGDMVSSPITISGTANVFEPQFRIQIYAQENKIADISSRATCGTGCRGDYSTPVDFSVDQEQPGTIVLFESSAKDGSQTNVVRIPVTLEPAAGATSQEQPVWRPGFVGHADPQTVAEKFASSILQWNDSYDRLLSATETDATVAMWNQDITSTYPQELATTLSLQRQNGEWVVLHVESGLFDVTCPSPRLDVIHTQAPSGFGPLYQEICGSFSRPSADWTVQATLDYAASNLRPSEAASTDDLSVTGQDFVGYVGPLSRYVGEDVTLQIRVYSGSGHTLGVWARRFQTQTPQQYGTFVFKGALPPAVLKARDALLGAARNNDYSALAALTNAEFEYGFFVRGRRSPSYFQHLAANGELDRMSAVLSLPWVSMQTAHGTVFVWPFAFGTDFDNPSAFQQKLVARLLRATGYTQKDLRSWRHNGYSGVRVGVNSDGTWAFFVEGYE